MQFTLTTLALVGAALAAPHPEITARAELPARSEALPSFTVGGAVGGSVILPNVTLSGTLTGVVSDGIPFGCIGGAINGQGVTLCARDSPAATPEVEKRQIIVGGGAEGSVLLPSATLSGIVTGIVSNFNPFGCIGGVINSEGTQVCAGIALPTASGELPKITFSA